MRPLARLFHMILGVQGALVRGVGLEDDDLIVEVARHGNAKPRCPKCGKAMNDTGKIVRVRWRHLDIFRTTCFLAIDARIGRCSKHGQRQERVPWAEVRARHTREFDRQVASLVQVADRTAAARMFGVSWRTVERMVKRIVQTFLPSDLLDDVIAIGVDETSYKRGHRYLTVVTDLLQRRVIWVGEGKSAETLHAFFDALGPRRAAKLQVVAMDMSEAYRSVVNDRAPAADIVYDRFHVVKLLLDAIDEIRRDEAREMSDEDRKALKGMRFAFLRNPKYKQPGSVDVIRAAVRSNRRLLAAYERRVSFEDFWTCTAEPQARKFAERWITSALRSRLEPLKRYARTLRSHLEGVLGFFRYEGLTSGFVEGMNNKIKLQIHKAFGFHSVGGLIAMIQLCCCGIDLSTRTS